MTKAKHSTGKRRIRGTARPGGEAGILSGRKPSRAFLIALEAVSRMGRKRK